MKIGEQKTKAAIFCAERLLSGRNHFCWVWYFLHAWNLFGKKINRLKNCLNSLNYPYYYRPYPHDLAYAIYWISKVIPSSNLMQLIARRQCVFMPHNSCLYVILGKIPLGYHKPNYGERTEPQLS